MLKISQAGKTGQNFTLFLEGRLIGPWVGELRLISESLSVSGRAIRLDLSNVSYADAQGVELLADLQCHGVMLANGSPFMTEQLKARPQGGHQG